MDASTLANIAQAIAVIVAVVFGIHQVRSLSASRRREAVVGLLGVWESLGILVFQREVSIDVVDDFYSGTIRQSWRKLGGYVAELRRNTERETRWKWFQWLAERMAERESSAPPLPAHVAHRSWRP